MNNTSVNLDITVNSQEEFSISQVFPNGQTKTRNDMIPQDDSEMMTSLLTLAKSHSNNVNIVKTLQLIKHTVSTIKM